MSKKKKKKRKEKKRKERRSEVSRNWQQSFSLTGHPSKQQPSSLLLDVYDQKCPASGTHLPIPAGFQP